MAHMGFTYLGLLFLIAIMGISMAGASCLWSVSSQREKERELLFVGDQFRQAIGLYYERTPGVVKRYPQSLEVLLKDSRYVTTQRYLRRIYSDPMTGRAEWGVIEAPGGGIMGVYSLSKAASIKKGNFREVDRIFEGKEKYDDWKFVYIPQSQVAAINTVEGKRSDLDSFSMRSDALALPANGINGNNPLR